jgi:hypothetical protein
MIDPTVETDLRLVTLQVESWKKLHNFITYALDKAKPIVSVEQERQFTEVRSILLQESEHVYDELNLTEDLVGKTMNVLQRATSLRGVRSVPVEEARRIELDWNAVFTKLGVVQGQLKARRKELRSRTVLSETLGRIFARSSARR